MDEMVDGGAAQVWPFRVCDQLNLRYDTTQSFTTRYPGTVASYCKQTTETKLAKFPTVALLATKKNFSLVFFALFH